jgi:hypothetical protein
MGEGLARPTVHLQSAQHTCAPVGPRARGPQGGITAAGITCWAAAVTGSRGCALGAAAACDTGLLLAALLLLKMA